MSPPARQRPTTVGTLLGQFPVSAVVGENLDAITGILARAVPGDIVVLPEGSLSGYEEDPTFLSGVDRAAAEKGLWVLGEEARRARRARRAMRCVPAS